MMKFSSTMTIQYDTIFSPFTAAQYPEALDWLRDSGFDAAEVCISHYRDLDVAGFKAELDRRGLACSNISTGQARTLENIPCWNDGEALERAQERDGAYPGCKDSGLQGDAGADPRTGERRGRSGRSGPCWREIWRRW